MIGEIGIIKKIGITGIFIEKVGIIGICRILDMYENPHDYYPV